MDSPMLQAAQQYRQRGFSIIPVGRDKKPLLKWAPYQTQLASEAQITEWWEKFPDANVAIVTGGISGLTVVDLDSPAAIKWFLQNFKLQTPCADTPGGMHAYCIFEEGTTNTVKMAGMDVDLRSTGGYVVAPPSVGADGKVYKWITSILDTPLAQLPSFLKDCISSTSFFISKEYEGLEVKKDQPDFQRLPVTSSDFQEGSRDDTLFHVSTCLKRGGMEESLARKVLVMLASQCTPPFSPEEANAKFDSALKRSDRKHGEIKEMIKEWVLTSSGYFLTSECFQRLLLTSRQDQKAGTLVFLKLAKNQVIEKHGAKNGCYRLKDTQCEEIDFVTATGDALGIKWPFEIERLVKILPKNIIIIAGEPNAGKSAFLLNLAEMNMDKFSVTYFSSEMGGLELKDRISNFKTPAAKWKAKFKERSSNFADVVDPTGLNIIDFLEIHDEFYKVGLFIKEIFDKLTTGIAVIAVQKNKGNDFGLGGQRGMEKARLYLAMQSHELKIVKGKNWATQQNPNGLSIDFDTIGGAKLLPRGTWK